MSTVSGDVRAQLPTFGGGIHVRKALGYVFSLRAEYDWMRAKGMNWQPSYSGPPSNAVLRQIFGTSGAVPVFQNYRTTIQEFTVQGVVTFNNIRFHKGKSNFAIYGFGGVGLMSYSTKYNQLDGNGNPYDYSGIINEFGGGGFVYKNRKKNPQGTQESGR